MRRNHCPLLCQFRRRELARLRERQLNTLFMQLFQATRHPQPILVDLAYHAPVHCCRAGAHCLVNAVAIAHALNEC